MAKTTGMEDSLFGYGELRRMRILRIARNYDVDPNVHPDGRFEQNRIDKLVNDPTVSFDNIRRSFQMTANNGFTNTLIAQQFPHHLPVTMSDPSSFIDTSFDFEGEQEFTDGGVTLADVSPFEPDDPGFDIETLLRQESEEEEEPVYPVEEGGEIEPAEQLLNPEATPPVTLPEETIPQAVEEVEEVE